MILIIAFATLVIGLTISIVHHKLNAKHIRNRIITIHKPDYSTCRDKVTRIDPVTRKVFSYHISHLDHCIPDSRKV